MRRFGRIAVFVLLLLIACYSAAWWVAADQSRSRIELGLKNLRDDEPARMEFEKIGLSGYPFRIGLAFEKAKVITERFEMHTEEPVLLERSITGSEYRVVLPNKIRFLERGVGRNCEYPTKPMLKVHVNPLELEKQLLFKGPESLAALLEDPNFAEAFRSARYEDKGGRCATEDGFEKTSNEGVLVDVSVGTGDKGKSVAVKAKVDAPRVSQPDISLEMKEVNIAFVVHGVESFKKGATKDAALDISSFLIDAGDFATNLTGRVEWNESSFLPFGNAEVSLKNYRKMVEVWQKRNAEIVKGKSLAVPEVDNAKLVALMEKLGAAQPGAADVTIKIDCPVNGVPTIGGIPVLELMTEIKALEKLPEPPAPEKPAAPKKKSEKPKV